MLYIIWNESNNVGIPILDEQHRGIVSIINSFYYFVQTGHGEEAIKPTLAMLEHYTRVHFITEEALMRDAGYPDIDGHIVLHKKLTARTEAIVRAAGKSLDTDTTLEFLKQWWLGHIKTEDRKYMPFVIKLMGVK
jgi:hemerythrin-like metal-binding protein